MKKFLLASTFSAVTLLSGFTHAADYIVDREGVHAAINFKVQHLGYSWLTGRFNNFNGTFSYEKDKADAAQIKIVIQTASLDSNHADVFGSCVGVCWRKLEISFVIFSIIIIIIYI